MTFRALRFTFGSGTVDLARCRIDPETPATFAVSTAGARPVAYVLTNADVTALGRRAALRAKVVDRGTKHPAKGLARLVIGFEKVPLIRGRYRATGQLTRSIRTLLRNAGEAGERQVYVIGAEVDLFDALWAGARTLASRTRHQRHEPSPGPLDGRGTHAERDALDILELLPLKEVPEELEQRFVGNSAAVHLVRQLIVRAARSEDPVLVLGETGTGKEVVARSIHEYGPRRAEPFIAVNCGAIPGELLESELFGHVRGAFTTALSTRDGLWKVAGRGTLFLDEIGDLRLDHQAKILRALQEATVRRVGDSAEVRVHARVIAATNRDLYVMARAGEFRPDLYFRLRSFLIRTPTLRDHRADIATLATFFWRAVTGNRLAALPAAVLDELQRRTWPGNARELRAVLSHMNSLFPDEEPRLAHLEAVFRLQGHATRPAVSVDETTGLERLRRRELLLRLEEAVRACRATLDPLVGRRGRIEDQRVERLRIALHHRIEELRGVLAGASNERPPGNVLPIEALEAVRQLRRRLVDLTATLDVNPDATRRLGHELGGQAAGAIAVIESELLALDRA